MAFAILEEGKKMKTELELQKEFIEKPELQEQLKFLQQGGLKGLQGVVIIEAFLKGIRDLGYKNTPFAFNEINDNSIQAGARNINYELVGKHNAKEIVVYDDGHGMPKEMLTVAVTWGGTHRQGSRKGFGKYGYGLPSASLSLAKKYTIYSKIKGGDWNKIVFDITGLDSGKSTDLDKIMSKPEKCKLPKFIEGFENKGYVVKKLESGTIIHYEDLDKVKPIGINNLIDTLMSDFGATYSNLLKTTNIYVNEKKVKPVDLCFATPGMLGYEDSMNDIKVPIDNPEYYGEKICGVNVVDDSGKKVEHEMKVRWSRLPAMFAVRNNSDLKSVEEAVIKGKTGSVADIKSFRFKQMRKNHGFVFRRLGRKMDVVRNFSGFYNLQNNDRYWMCEVNFPPILDEHFEVNTSKQQIIPDERILNSLKDQGIFKILKDIKEAYSVENSVIDAKSKTAKKEDQSIKDEVEIVAEAAKLVEGESTATVDYQERVERARKRTKQKIEEIAKKQKITVEQAKVVYEDVYKDRPYKFSEEKNGKFGPFLKFDELTDTIEVILNVDHDFYKRFYMGPGSNDNSRDMWRHFFLTFGTIFFRYTEDHQDFVNDFLNQLGEKLRVVARKRYDKRNAEGRLEEDNDPMDDDLPETTTNVKH